LLASSIAVLIVACQDPVTDLTSLGENPNTAQDCQVVAHAMGDTCVPLNPQRIVTLALLDNLLVLGVKPVGAYRSHLRDEFVTFIPEQTDGIESIGTLHPPNLEKILRLQPDLIIGTWQTDIYDQLSKIAPTVMFSDKDERFRGWQNTFRAYADVLGKSQDAEQVLDQYRSRVADFRAAMGDRLSETEVSLVWFAELGDFRVYLKRSFGGQILDELGLPRPPNQRQDEYYKSGLSLESIPELGGEVIFLLSRFYHGQNNPSPSEISEFEQFVSHPLWLQLEAVQNGQVYQVNDEVWVGGDTPVAANLVLDDLYQYLLNK
jgi:iron complex transport system substrate-binding protein